MHRGGQMLGSPQTVPAPGCWLPHSILASSVTWLPVGGACASTPVLGWANPETRQVRPWPCCPQGSSQALWARQAPSSVWWPPGPFSAPNCRRVATAAVTRGQLPLPLFSLAPRLSVDGSAVSMTTEEDASTLYLTQQ